MITHHLKIFQIVLDDVPERVEAADALRANVEEQGYDIERIPAVRWPEGPHHGAAPEFRPENALGLALDLQAREDNRLSLGQIGCSASHQVVYDRLLRTRNLLTKALIFEDDVVEVDMDEATSFINFVADRWDPGWVLQLGDLGECFWKDYDKEPLIRTEDDVEEVIRWPFTTHCYAIDYTGACWARSQNSPIRAQADVVFYNAPTSDHFVPWAPRNIARLRTGKTPGVAKLGGFASHT